MAKTPTPTTPAANPDLDNFQKGLSRYYGGKGNSAQGGAFGGGVPGGNEGSSQKWSDYDTGLNVTKESDYGYATQEQRARQQPVSEKLMNGLSKAGANAAVAAVGALAAPVDWSIAAMSDQVDISNAPIGSALAKWNDKVAEENPHYYSQQEMDAPALSAQNLLSTNFLTDKVLSGVGFLAGAAAGGWATGGLGELAAAGSARTLATGLPRLAQVFGEGRVGSLLGRMAVGAENHVAALEEIATALRTGDEGAAKASMERALTSIKVQTRAQQAYATAASTHGEAIMEAMGQHTQLVQQLTDKKLGEKQQRRNEMIASIQQANPNVTPDQLGEMLAQAGLDQSSVTSLTADEEKDIDAVTSAARNAVYWGNVAVLSASNFSQMRSLLSRGYGDLLAEETKGIWKPVLMEDGKYALNAPKWAQRAAYGLGQSIKHALPEVLEEGSQTLLQKTADKVGTDMLAEIDHRRSDLGHQLNPTAAKLLRDDVVNFANTAGRMAGDMPGVLLKQAGEKEFQESLLLGGLIGVLGDKGHQLLNGNEAGRRQKADAQLAVEFMNNYGRNGAFAEKSRGVIRQLSNALDGELAVQNRSAAAYDETRNNSLREMVVAAKKSGRMDDLRSSIKAWEQIAAEEDKTGQTPEGEAPISAQGMQEVMKQVDELDALYDQTKVVYGRAMDKAASVDVDAAFEQVASTRLRAQSLEKLAQRVSTETQGASGEAGFDLKGFLAGRPQRAIVSSQEIDAAVDTFAEQRGLASGDPAMMSLRNDIAHAVKLRQANGQSNETLLNLQRNTLGNRRAILHQDLQTRPAMMPQYRRVLQDQAAARTAPANPATDAAAAGSEDATPEVGDTAITPSLAQQRKQALEALNQELPDEEYAAQVEAINDDFDRREAEQSRAAAAEVQDAARNGTPSGTDADPVQGDTEQVGDLADMGQDADVVLNSVSTQEAQQSAQLTDEDSVSGIAGLPVLPAAPTYQVALGQNKEQFAAAGVQALNNGSAQLVMTNRPLSVDPSGKAAYEFVVRNADGSVGETIHFEPDQLAATAGGMELIAAHEAMMAGELDDVTTAAGITVKMQAVVELTAGGPQTVSQAISQYPASQQELLFDEAHAVVVRVDGSQAGQLTSSVLWGTTNGEREQAIEALLSSPNIGAGDYLIHSTLRQDGAPAVLALAYPSAVGGLQQVMTANRDGREAAKAVNALVHQAQQKLGLTQMRWDGQQLHVGDQPFTFNEAAYNQGERGLDKLFTAPEPAAAEVGTAGGPTDNPVLNELQAQVQGQQAQAQPAAPVFTTVVAQAAQQVRNEGNTPQSQQLREASVTWTPQNSAAQLRVAGVADDVRAQLAAPMNDPEDLADGEDVATEGGATLPELRAEVLRMLPDGVTIDEVEAAHRRMVADGQPVGLIIGHAMRLVSGLTGSLRTARHESYHIASKYLFTADEKAALYRYSDQRGPVISDAQIDEARAQYPHLATATDGEVEDYLHEEWLAEKFADYMDAKDASQQKGFLARMWAKLKARLVALTSPEVRRLFDALGRGEMRSRELAPMFSEVGAPAWRDVAFSYIPEARTLDKQRDAISTTLAYYINAKYHRLAVRPQSAATNGKDRTFFLPSLFQLTNDFVVNTGKATRVGELTDQQLLEVILHHRKQEDTEAIPDGLEGEALQQYLDARGLYLPDATTEWKLNRQASPAAQGMRAYRTLYNVQSAKASLMGEVLGLERGMRASQTMGEQSSEDYNATEASDRDYDAGMLEGGAHLPDRLALYLSTVIYREPNDDGSLVVKSVDPVRLMRRLRTIANVLVVPESLRKGSDSRSKVYARGSLADFVYKVNMYAAAAQGTREGAMLNAVAARITHDFGRPDDIEAAQARGDEGKLANLYSIFQESNQLRIPALIGQWQQDGTLTTMSAQRRPLWTDVLSTGAQLWAGLTTRERRRNAEGALKAITALRQRVADWTKQVGPNGTGPAPSRTDVLRELKKVRNAYGRLGLVLPEEFYLGAVMGTDAVYDVRVRETRDSRALPLPALMTTKERDDDGNPIPGAKARKTMFKEQVETSNQRRTDLLDDLQQIAETVLGGPEVSPFEPGFIERKPDQTPAQQAQITARLKARNLAQAGADYDIVAVDNMWLDANGRKQRSYAPSSFLIEQATNLEAGLLTPDSQPLAYLRENYDGSNAADRRARAGAQQEGVLGRLGRYGSWLKTNWLVRNHLAGTGSLGGLRFFYDGGVYVKNDGGQVGQTATQLSERDVLVARMARFQNGLVTANLLESSKMSLLVQHSEHTGDESWVEYDSKAGRITLADRTLPDGTMVQNPGLAVATQHLLGLATHMDLVLDELYGDELWQQNLTDPATGQRRGLAPLPASERVNNFHGRLPKSGEGAVELPLRRRDAEGNLTLDAGAEVETDDQGNPAALTREEMRKLLYSTNDYSALPRGLQPLEMPLLQGATVADPSGETEDRVPLTLGALLAGGQGQVESEMLRDVLERDINSQYDQMQKRFGQYGINRQTLSTLAGMSGQRGAMFSRMASKERGLSGNQAAYQNSESFVADFLFKSQLFRDAYGQLTRGHEAYFGNSTDVTKRAKGMGGFGPHLGQGKAKIAVVPTINEYLDSKTLLPTEKGSENAVGVDGTDAQGYVTTKRLLEYLVKDWGIMPDDLALIEKACNGEDIVPDEARRIYGMLHEVSAGPIKNMVYGLVSREGGMRNPLYVKTSVLPLIKAFTSVAVMGPDGPRWVARPGLEYYHDMRERMERQQVDELYHTTAVKAGGTQLSNLDSTTDLLTHEVENRFFRRQQVVPAGKENIIDGSQKLALLDSNIGDAAPVTVGGVTSTFGQLRAAFNQLQADVRSWQRSRAQGLAENVLDGSNLLWALVHDQQRDQGLDQGALDLMAQQMGKLVFNPNLPQVEATMVSALLNFLGKQSLRYKTQGGKYTLASSAGMQVYDLLDDAGNVVGVTNPFEARPETEFDQQGKWNPAALTHENGAPRYGAPRALKMHNPKMSEADKFVTMGEARGHSMLLGLGQLLKASPNPQVQALADQGLLNAVLGELSMQPGSVSASSLLTALKNYGGHNGKGEFVVGPLSTISVAQKAALEGVLAKLPAEPVNVGPQVESVDYAECIISGDFLAQHGLTPEDLLRPDRIAPEVREEITKMLGYRIPTQAHQSMIPLKVIGVAPAIMGSTIFAPSGITYVSGADFDIDALFTKRPAIWMNKQGQAQLYGNSATPQEQEQEFRQAVKGDPFYKKVLPFARREVRKNLKGVFLRLQRATVPAVDELGQPVLGPDGKQGNMSALPERVLSVLAEAVQVGGFANLQKLRDQVWELRNQIERDVDGSMQQIGELAALDRLRVQKAKTKEAALRQKLAKQRYPDLSPTAARERNDRELAELDGRIRANYYDAAQPGEASAPRKFTAAYIIAQVQKQTELLRTILETENEQDDQEASDSQPIPSAMQALEKVLAHYLALDTLNLPMTAWQAAAQGRDTQQAMSNRLLKIELSMLTAPGLWDQVSMATSVDELVDMSADFRDFLNQAPAVGQQAYNAEATQLDQRTATYGGRDNIGFSAYMNAVLAHAGKQGLRVARRGLQVGGRLLTTFGRQSEQDLQYRMVKDDAVERIELVEGREQLTAQTLTNHMSFDTDNAKYQGAKYLNRSEYTTAQMMVLEKLGLGQNRTEMLVMQPAVRAMAEYRTRQENSVSRSLDDPRDFGQRLGDLETLVQDLLLERLGRGTSTSANGRRATALTAAGFAKTLEVAEKGALRPRKGQGIVAKYPDGRTVYDFSDEQLVGHLNNRALGDALYNALLSSRLPKLVGRGIATDTMVINSVLDGLGVVSDDQVKAFYHYVVEQRAINDTFEDVTKVTDDLYDVAAVTSLVKGQLADEGELLRASRVIGRVEEQGLPTLRQANGSAFSFRNTPLMAEAVKTIRFASDVAKKNFLRFNDGIRSILNPIMDTVDAAGGKGSLRERLTGEMLNVLASRRAARTTNFADFAAGRRLLLDPEENIVKLRQLVVAANPLLATNPLMKKLEEQVPGQRDAMYWGLRVDLVGVEGDELQQLRDSFMALRLHADPQVQEFADALERYALTADGPSVSARSITRILPASSLAKYSTALDLLQAEARSWGPESAMALRQDVTERLFSRADVRGQVPVREQTHGGLNVLAQLVRQQLDEEAEAPDGGLLGAAAAQLRKADQLAAQRGVPVTVSSPDILELGLRRLSPDIDGALNDMAELVTQVDSGSGKLMSELQPQDFEARKRVLEDTLLNAVNTELGLTGGKDQVSAVRVFGGLPGNYTPPMMGMTVLVQKDGTVSLSWRLPAALRLSDGQQQAPEGNPLAGDAREVQSNAAALVAPKATTLAVAYADNYDATYFIENNLTVPASVPQMPHLSFSDWVGELNTRQAALNAVGEGLVQAGDAFAERIGDVAAGVATAQNDQAILEAMKRGKTEDQQLAQEQAAVVLRTIYGQDLGEMPFPAQVTIVNAQINGQTEISCEL